MPHDVLRFAPGSAAAHATDRHPAQENNAKGYLYIAVSECVNSCGNGVRGDGGAGGGGPAFGSPGWRRVVFVDDENETVQCSWTPELPRIDDLYTYPGGRVGYVADVVDAPQVATVRVSRWL